MTPNNEPSDTNKETLAQRWNRMKAGMAMIFTEVMKNAGPDAVEQQQRELAGLHGDMSPAAQANSAHTAQPTDAGVSAEVVNTPTKLDERDIREMNANPDFTTAVFDEHVATAQTGMMPPPEPPTK